MQTVFWDNLYNFLSSYFYIFFIFSECGRGIENEQNPFFGGQCLMCFAKNREMCPPLASRPSPSLITVPQISSLPLNIPLPPPVSNPFLPANFPIATQPTNQGIFLARLAQLITLSRSSSWLFCHWTHISTVFSPCPLIDRQLYLLVS